MVGKQGGDGWQNPIMKPTSHTSQLLRLYIPFQIVYKPIIPLSIRNSEVERLGRALSGLTGEGLTQTILEARRERYPRVRATRQQERLVEDLTVIARRPASLAKLEPPQSR
jgi:hypothetical protein